MGFQKNSSGTVTVFAKLTDLGKKYLLTESSKFQITQFSPLDDEVDYTLWNPEQTSGSEQAGEVIEGMPVLEPVSSAVFQSQYNLINGYPRNAARMPVLNVPQGYSHTFVAPADSATPYEPWDFTLQFINVEETKVKVINTNSTVCEVNATGAQPIDLSPLAVSDFVGAQGFEFAEGFICDANATITVTPYTNYGPGNKETKVIIAGWRTNAQTQLLFTVQQNDTIPV